RAGRPGSVEAPLAVYAALEMIEEFGWPSTSPEEAVLVPARRGDLLEVEAALDFLRRLPQPQSVPVLDRCDRHVQLVDQVGVEELAHRRDPAADPHVLAVGELERALEGGGGGGVEEVEGRLAGCERLPLVMSEHDDGRVEGRILAPPADPAVVGPGAALGPELHGAPCSGSCHWECGGEAWCPGTGGGSGHSRPGAGATSTRPSHTRNAVTAAAGSSAPKHR